MRLFEAFDFFFFFFYLKKGDNLKSLSNIDCWEYLDYLTFGDHGICKYVG